MQLTITSVDHAPEGLHGQLPIVVELLRQIPGPERPDYWLGALHRPIRWTVDGAERLVTHVVVAARWEGTVLEPGVRNVPVGIAYVTDAGVLADERLDPAKCSFVAIGVAFETGDGAIPAAGSGPPGPALQYRFAWDPELFRRAYHLSNRHARLSKGTRSALIVVALLSCGLLVLLSPGYGFVAFLGILAAFWAWVRWRPALLARQIARNDPDASGEIVHLYTDYGLTVRTGSTSSTLSWRRVLRTLEVSGLLLVYIGPSLAHYLPLDVVPPGERGTLRALLRRQLGERAGAIPEPTEAAP